MIAADFTKAQVDKKRKDDAFAMTCIQCKKEQEPQQDGATPEPEELPAKFEVVEFQAGKIGLSIEANATKAPKEGSQAAKLGVQVENQHKYIHTHADTVSYNQT